ncbi:hypothetical protein QAD02_002318 [Eretmocerus hayati]|uniref:Uncharacterized protein n=1 Tax=Eretmocerus hayati TaxID=131215 RepID=A0ACC2NL66_9HYME|nr:hypothetical protein QAD02_002318 [Eretmocerus hayati]
MAFRNLLTCFIYEGRFPLQNMSRIDGDQNVHECEIAINRREGFDRPALGITSLTRLCFVRNRCILQEIRTVQENPLCVRLNVLARKRTSSCFICDARDNIHRISVEYGSILKPLSDGIGSINQPCIILGPYLTSFLEGLRTVSRKREAFHDPLNLDDNEFVCSNSLKKTSSKTSLRFVIPFLVKEVIVISRDLI